jgi:hypothetical protein
LGALLQADLKELEVASTVIDFRAQGNDWPSSVEKTCQFKGLAGGGPFVVTAGEKT